MTEFKSLKMTARRAGILYLLLGIVGIFGLMYVPSKIFVHGDALATAANIIEKELLFRWGMVGYLACQLFFVFLVLELNRLLRSVDEHLSKIMVSLVIVSVPIAFFNIINQIAALILVTDTEIFTSFGKDQLNEMALFFLNLYEQGIVVVEIFWGLWLFPFGLLVYQSGFIPKIFGVLLMIACVGYLANSLTAMVYPDFRSTVAIFTSVAGTVGEFAIIFWLLIKGIRTPKPAV